MGLTLAIRKILKWILIITGVICGVIFIAIQWLKTNNYIDNVKWDRLGNDLSSYVQHLASQMDLHGVFSTLGIPVSSGLALGVLIGFFRTK